MTEASLNINKGKDESAMPTFDKQTVKRLQDIQVLKEDDKKHLFALMDAFLRDAKTKQAYAG